MLVTVKEHLYIFHKYVNFLRLQEDFVWASFCNTLQQFQSDELLRMFLYEIRTTSHFYTERKQCFSQILQELIKQVSSLRPVLAVHLSGISQFYLIFSKELFFKMLQHCYIFFCSSQLQRRLVFFPPLAFGVLENYFFLSLLLRR